jgi:CubicO group peptidase (beta-lactamase class C family)
MRNKFLLLLFLLISITFCSCDYYAKCFFWRAANVNDFEKFPSRPVSKGDSISKFYIRDKNATINIPIGIKKDFTRNFEEFLYKTKTTSILIVKNDSIIYENYFFNHSKESLNPSFSIAKSLTSTLIGIAISEGKIKSVNDPITDYLPEIKSPSTDKITIEHLLNQRGGIDYNNIIFNPFGTEAKLYYGTYLKKHIRHYIIKHPPGKKFEYTSFSAELLGILLERAVKMPISEYLQIKIWQPLGMESNAYWSLDSKEHKTEKAFCCLNAVTRDFARFGRLYLNRGKWNGKQIVPEEWVEKCSHPSFPGQNNYSYFWWLGKNGVYYARGYLDQYIFINPEKNIIMVRLGKQVTSYGLWLDVFQYICNTI